VNPSSKPITDASTIRVHVARFDPAVDRERRYETYEVPRTPNMRIMDALDYIYETLAVDLGYRWLCGSKKCGTCALKVNGSPKLACWDEAEPEMTLEPLDNMPVLRDLAISRDGYEARLRSIQPLLVREKEYPGFPEPLKGTDMAPMSHLRECIQCLACQSVCPVLQQPDNSFAGPAVLVALSEVAQDPRDEGDRGHIAVQVASVFQCVSCYECERVCPSEIPIVGEAIEPLKRIAYQADEDSPGKRRAAAFVESVRKLGYVNPSAVALGTKGVTLDSLRVALRMARRGKIGLLDAFGKRASPGAEAIRKTLDSSEKTA
jgi:succinate dehydrogenase/fumarate reductase iron-sulfur protein